MRIKRALVWLLFWVVVYLACVGLVRSTEASLGGHPLASWLGVVEDWVYRAAFLFGVALLLREFCLKMFPRP